jgi:hypothetical protein
MKRFYMIHQSSWAAPVQVGKFKGELYRAFDGRGCCWWGLQTSGYRIVAGSFLSEDREHAWNSHPAVTHLHHPVREKTLTLGALLTPAHAYKRFSEAHLELLKSALGATETDTMEILNQKVAFVHPGCTVYPVPKKTSLWIY